MDVDLELARLLFRQAADQYWAKWDELNTLHRSTREQAQMEDIAAEWAARGLLADLLRPLLADRDRGVRCWAAWHLAERGEITAALPVLRQLDEEWSELPSFMASVQLERHGHPTRTVQQFNGQRYLNDG